MSVVGVTNGTELAELVRRIIAGDGIAEDELIRRYEKAVGIIIDQIVRSQSVTEDLSQDTFKTALEKVRHGDVRDPERLSGFISGMARNLAIDYVRKARCLINREDIGEAEQIPDPAPSQLEEILKKERRRIVRQVIDELKIQRDREVILRFYIAEEDKDQICAELGLTRSQFNNVIFRALNRFKELYVKTVGDP